MINRIHDYMIHNKMIEEGGCILAAVSGGADSMCLLEILLELQAKAGFQLRVLHVHHGLRENAEGDLEYVAGYCAASRCGRIRRGGRNECGRSCQTLALRSP